MLLPVFAGASRKFYPAGNSGIAPGEGAKVGSTKKGRDGKDYGPGNPSAFQLTVISETQDVCPVTSRPNVNEPDFCATT